MLIFHLYIYFGEVSVQVFCPFFNWVFHLRVLWVLRLKYAPPIASQYHSLYSVFHKAQILSIISSIGYAFGVTFLKSSPNSHLSTCFFLLSSKSFIVLYIIFTSVIQFELIFVTHIDSLFFCIWMSSCSITICWKDYIFSIVLPLLLCWRSLDYFCIHFFWFYSPVYWLICLFFHQNHTALITVDL